MRRDKCDDRDSVTKRGNGIALDIETYSSDPKSRDALDAFKGKIRLVSIADASGIQTFDVKKAPLSRETLEALRSGDLIIHNASFELRWFGRHYGFIPKSVFCTLTADRLLIPSKKVKHDLKTVLERRIGIVIDKDIDHKAWGNDVLTDRQLEYARIDVEHEHTLRKVLSAELKASDLERIFRLETELLPITAKMELHGFAVSTEKMQKIMERENEICDELERDIRAEFNDQELNLNSPPQLLAAFEKAGTKLKSTAKESLIKTTNPVAVKLRVYKKSKKLAGMIKSLLKDVKNGRLHSSFNPLGATHGRFSSSDPNLQNVHRGELRVLHSEPGRERSDLRGLLPDRASRRGAYRERRHHDRGAQTRRRSPCQDCRGKSPLRSERGYRRATDDHRQSLELRVRLRARRQGIPDYARTEWGAELTLDQATAYRFNYFDLYRGIKRWHNECGTRPSIRTSWKHAQFGGAVSCLAATPNGGDSTCSLNTSFLAAAPIS